jgi:hypothetical protein
MSTRTNFTLSKFVGFIEKDDVDSIRQNMPAIVKAKFLKKESVVKLIKLHMPNEGEEELSDLRDFYLNLLG